MDIISGTRDMVSLEHAWDATWNGPTGHRYVQLTAVAAIACVAAFGLSAALLTV